MLQILKKVMENSALNKEKLSSITGFSEGLAWQTFIGQLIETEVKVFKKDTCLKHGMMNE